MRDGKDYNIELFRRIVVQNYLGGGIIKDSSMKLDVIVTVVQNYLRGQQYRIIQKVELFERTIV